MLTDGRTDRQTDVTMIIVAFLNFANAPKNQPRCFCNHINTAYGLTVSQTETIFTRYSTTSFIIPYKILPQLCNRITVDPESIFSLAWEMSPPKLSSRFKSTTIFFRLLPILPKVNRA
jgi:hypothetical protein